MQKRERTYLVIIFVILIGLSFSIFSIINLKSDLIRENTIKLINEQLNQQIIGELSETKLKEDGFYVHPAVVVFGDDIGTGNIAAYNKFNEKKSFVFSFSPNVTMPFPYSNIELIEFQGPLIIDPGKNGEYLFGLQAKGDFSSGTRGQFHVDIFSNNEKIGQDDFFVFVATEDLLRAK